MKYSLLIPFFLLSFWQFNPLYGNDSTDLYLHQAITVVEVDQADWEAATEGLDYGVAKMPEVHQPQKIEGGEFILTLLKILGILGIVVLIFFLLRYFVGIQGVQKTKNRTFDPNAEIDTQTVAEHIHEFDLEALLKQAIERKEYSVATRLYYLLAIKTLSEKKLINWKKDKTNRNYLNELSGTAHRNPFRELTNIFERVWYGEVPIEAKAFGAIQGQFRQFIQSISSVN